MSDKQKIGNLGEESAVTFLESEGYQVLETNWRYQHKEIDIIAAKDQELAIIEVKTRKKHALTEPMEAVTAQKQKFLIDATDAYLEQSDMDLEVRFDVISVLHDGEKVIHLQHIKNAFIPEFE